MPRITYCLIPVLFALAGCGGDTPPSQADAAKGREVIKTVLDAWVKGGKPEDLKPVVVNDPDWTDGYKLTKYEIDPADNRSGVDLLLKVKLSLTKDGKSQDKSVNFVVGVGSKTVVIRYQ